MMVKLVCSKWRSNISYRNQVLNYELKLGDGWQDSIALCKLPSLNPKYTPLIKKISFNLLSLWLIYLYQLKKCELRSRVLVIEC